MGRILDIDIIQANDVVQFTYIMHSLYLRIKGFLVELRQFADDHHPHAIAWLES